MSERIFCDLCGQETTSYATYRSMDAPTLHLCKPSDAPVPLFNSTTRPAPQQGRNCVKHLQEFLSAPTMKEPA